MGAAKHEPRGRVISKGPFLWLMDQAQGHQILRLRARHIYDPGQRFPNKTSPT